MVGLGLRRQSGCPERQPVDFQGNYGLEISRTGGPHGRARPRRGRVREQREGIQTYGKPQLLLLQGWEVTDV